MSEKRKPKYTILLKEQGKKSKKVELFTKSQWRGECRKDVMLGQRRFRLRVNGRWWPENKRVFFTKTEVKELFFRAMES